jgi:hypothetical protein
MPNRKIIVSYDEVWMSGFFLKVDKKIERIEGEEGRGSCRRTALHYRVGD